MIFSFLGSIIISDEVTITVDSDLNGASPQFTLTCISTGGPATTVTWTRDFVEVIENTKTVLDDPVTAQYTHTLTVTEILEGLYTCIVSNKASMSSGTLQVQCEYLLINLLSCKNQYFFYAAPSPPSDVDVSQNGLDSILVSWTVSGESIVTGYIISYKQQNGVHSDSVTVDDTAVTSTIITGLMIGATYSISVVATSNTLPSDETTAPDITIGNMETAK